MHQVPKVNDVVPKFDSKILIKQYSQYTVLGPFGLNAGVWVFEPNGFRTQLDFFPKIYAQKEIHSRFVRVILAQGPC